MFGIDWDGDGEDGLFDDMITLDILDDEDEDDLRGGKPNGSCLVFLMIMGSIIALPIVGLVKILA